MARLSQGLRTLIGLGVGQIPEAELEPVLDVVLARDDPDPGRLGGPGGSLLRDLRRHRRDLPERIHRVLAWMHLYGRPVAPLGEDPWEATFV